MLEPNALCAEHLRQNLLFETCVRAHARVSGRVLRSAQMNEAGFKHYGTTTLLRVNCCLTNVLWVYALLGCIVQGNRAMDQTALDDDEGLFFPGHVLTGIPRSH